MKVKVLIPFGFYYTGRDLVNMAKKRPNVIPIIEDARHPAKYRMLVPMVDVVFADVAQPDQVCLLQSSIYNLIWHSPTSVQAYLRISINNSRKTF